MAERKKTTKEERMEIVLYCINHDRNYKETAVKYGCSYSQVYSWVRKYDRKGTDGLNDNRGHRKAEADLTDNEKLEREIKRMKEELRQKGIEVRFLKNSTNQSGGDRESTKDCLARLQHKMKITIYKSIQKQAMMNE